MLQRRRRGSVLVPGVDRGLSKAQGPWRRCVSRSGARRLTPLAGSVRWRGGRTTFQRTLIMANTQEYLFQNIPPALRSEFVQRVAGTKGVRIERIVSRGHCSPAGYWYDQAETEWVMLVKGAARIRFEADDSVIEMTAGDHITIPPRA